MDDAGVNVSLCPVLLLPPSYGRCLEFAPQPAHRPLSQKLFLGSQCEAFTLAQTSGLRGREAKVEVKRADSETNGRLFIGGLCHSWLCPGRGRGKGLRQEDGPRSQTDSGPDLSWATSAHVVVT